VMSDSHKPPEPCPSVQCTAEQSNLPAFANADYGRSEHPGGYV
jgi:hypothetical protein